MRGVWFSKQRKKYRVKHKGKVIGFYEDEKEAKKVKKELNDTDFYEKYNDIVGNNYGDYKVIGLSDKNKINHRGYLVPIYVCRNNKNGDVREIRRDSLLNGGAVGNKRGIKKAYPSESGNSFQSRIIILGEDYFLGTFLTKKEAEKTYDDALLNFVKKGKRPSNYKKIPASDAKIIHYMMSGKLKGVNYVKDKKTWNASLYLNGKFMINKNFPHKTTSNPSPIRSRRKIFQTNIRKIQPN